MAKTLPDCVERRCPHCGGLHFGQRFDDCTFVRLLADPSATDEQRINAQEALDLHTADLARAARSETGAKP